jgi:uncharacterized lipoprotein
MLDWIRHVEEILDRWHQQRTSPPDRDLLVLILKGMHHMALDFTKINASVARLGTDVTNLIAALPNPAQAAADQASLDALAGTLDTSSTAAETALAPPAPVAPPAA